MTYSDSEPQNLNQLGQIGVNISHPPKRRILQNSNDQIARTWNSAQRTVIMGGKEVKP